MKDGDQASLRAGSLSIIAFSVFPPCLRVSVSPWFNFAPTNDTNFGR